MSQDCHWPTIKKKMGAWHILFSYWEYRVQKKTKLRNQLKVNIGLICVCSNLPFWEKASPDNNLYSTPVTGSYDSPTFSLRCITSLLGLPWHSSRYFHLLHKWLKVHGEIKSSIAWKLWEKRTTTTHFWVSNYQLRTTVLNKYPSESENQLFINHKLVKIQIFLKVLFSIESEMAFVSLWVEAEVNSKWRRNVTTRLQAQSFCRADCISPTATGQGSAFMSGRSWAR